MHHLKVALMICCALAPALGANALTLICLGSILQQRPTSSSWPLLPKASQRPTLLHGPYRPSRFAQQDPNNCPQQQPSKTSTLQDYFSLLRPVTLIQAVGAWIVGRLLVASPVNIVNNPKEWLAMLVVFTTYGVGMAANDCADARLDKEHPHRSHRAIASGRISVKQGWMFVALLTTISLWTAFRGVSPQFGSWCASNLALMLLYAAGLQNLLLVKNALVGWLCISPLWGATTLTTSATTTTRMMNTQMSWLAATGFSLGVIREILKDCQDVELDRGVKFTLPLWMGESAAVQLSFCALGVTLALLQTPIYRRWFASPLYTGAWVVASGMCLRAYARPTISQQQAGVKKSIYVILAGLIGSMMLAK